MMRIQSVRMKSGREDSNGLLDIDGIKVCGFTINSNCAK